MQTSLFYEIIVKDFADIIDVVKVIQNSKAKQLLSI
jgi:hypothetical protein